MKIKVVFIFDVISIIFDRLPLVGCVEADTRIIGLGELEESSGASWKLRLASGQGRK